jgi:hypothetical protein
VYTKILTRSRGLFILAEHYNAVVHFPAFAFGELRKFFFILHSFILLIEKLVTSSGQKQEKPGDEPGFSC